MSLLTSQQLEILDMILNTVRVLLDLRDVKGAQIFINSLITTWIEKKPLEKLQVEEVLRLISSDKWISDNLPSTWQQTFHNSLVDIAEEHKLSL